VDGIRGGQLQAVHRLIAQGGVQGASLAFEELGERPSHGVIIEVLGLALRAKEDFTIQLPIELFEAIQRHGVDHHGNNQRQDPYPGRNLTLFGIPRRGGINDGDQANPFGHIGRRHGEALARPIKSGGSGGIWGLRGV
jgi:hypothetical protein